MKKSLLILLVMIMAVFALTGCDGITPAEGEGEGEGEGEFEGSCPEISLSGSVVIDGKTYVRGMSIWDLEGPELLDLYDDITLTITYKTPTEGTAAYLSGFTYGLIDTIFEDVIKDKEIGLLDLEIPMFPNEDYTVYTGSLKPYLLGWQTDCTAFMIKVISCDGDCVCKLPFIVDNKPPYASIEIDLDEEACPCDGCALTFTSEILEPDCDDDILCCGDDCSGFAGWSIAIYDTNPHNKCCSIPCAEPVFTCSGTDCPIECTTDCLEEGTYYVITNLVDNVGIEKEYYVKIEIGSDCDIVEIIEYEANINMDQCPDWENDYYNITESKIYGDCGKFEFIG
ncbi:MAG: hypothetical protein PHD33_00855 [Atribacterota bacterium]|nr:hypothetical protein [Atribacterota bacterium]